MTTPPTTRTAPITPERLAEIKARHAASAPGIWTVEEWHDEEDSEDGNSLTITRHPYLALRTGPGAGSWEAGRIHARVDADFAAHAHQDVPDLVAYAEACGPLIEAAKWLRATCSEGKLFVAPLAALLGALESLEGRGT
jgi:hypothetical protein